MGLRRTCSTPVEGGVVTDGEGFRNDSEGGCLEYKFKDDEFFWNHRPSEH